MKNILRNITLSIAAIQVPIIMELTKTKESFANSGIASKFLLLLIEYLGFSYEINTAEFSSIQELLNKNKIHLAVPLSQSFERSNIMDFSYPFNIEGIRFFVARPGELSKITAIIFPFLFQVWIAILVSFVISVIIFNIIFWNDSKLYKRKSAKIIEIAWALFGSFTAKGNDLFSPSGQSCKLLVSGWLLAIFVITSSYSGALMSFIAFPGRECVPRTFSELITTANKGYYTVSFAYESSIGKFIFNSTEGNGLALKKLFELNKVEDSWLNRDILDRILKNKLAYIWYENHMEIQATSFGLDNFVISKDHLTFLSTGFGISKKFLHQSQLNKAILRFIEAGFMMKFANDEKAKTEKEYYSNITEGTEEFHVLTVSDLAGPFSLLIIGYLLSIIAFFIEIINSKLYRSK